MTTELKQIVEYLKDYSYKVSSTASTGTYVNSGELNKKEDSIILTYNTSNLQPIKIDLEPLAGRVQFDENGNRLGEVFNDYDGNIATGEFAHAEGFETKASNENMEDDFPYTALAAHAEGYMTQAAGDYSHAENIKTIARGYASHAEGNITQATGDYSHAEGLDTEAEGEGAHAEGLRTSSKGNHSHAEGLNTQANGSIAHAEGGATIARGEGSHAEGCWSRAEGDYSHAEGESTIATGYASHAEGFRASSKGNHSHAEGEYTIATGRAQHVQGIYNIENSNYAHIVGNGSREDEYDNEGKLVEQHRSNAHTLDWDGNAWFAGDVTVGENNDKLITAKELPDSVYIGEAVYKRTGYADTSSGGPVTVVDHYTFYPTSSNRDISIGTRIIVTPNQNSTTVQDVIEDQSSIIQSCIVLSFEGGDIPLETINGDTLLNFQFIKGVPVTFICTDIEISDTGSPFYHWGLEPGNYSYSTEDLEAGISELPTGTLYYVYEE